MPVNNESPKFSEDAGVLAQRMSAMAQSSGDDNNKNQFETMADALATALTRILGKFGIKIRLRTLGSTGLFKQITPAQSWANKSINEGAPSVGARGGVLADIAVNKLQFKMDFSNIAKPAIEGFPVTSMTYESLGNLTPADTGGGGRGAIGRA